MATGLFVGQCGQSVGYCCPMRGVLGWTWSGVAEPRFVPWRRARALPRYCSVKAATVARVLAVEGPVSDDRDHGAGIEPFVDIEESPTVTRAGFETNLCAMTDYMIQSRKAGYGASRRSTTRVNAMYVTPSEVSSR